MNIHISKMNKQTLLILTIQCWLYWKQIYKIKSRFLSILTNHLRTSSSLTRMLLWMDNQAWSFNLVSDVVFFSYIFFCWKNLLQRLKQKQAEPLTIFKGTYWKITFIQRADSCFVRHIYCLPILLFFQIVKHVTRDILRQQALGASSLISFSQEIVLI